MMFSPRMYVTRAPEHTPSYSDCLKNEDKKAQPTVRRKLRHTHVTLPRRNCGKQKTANLVLDETAVNP